MNLARCIDHAVLKPEYTAAEAGREIAAGVRLGVRAVCVRPGDLEAAARLCAGTDTAVCCVVAFPHGIARPELKAAEAARCLELGAAELDMVVHYGLIRGGDWARLEDDIRAVTDIARPAGVAVKAILETGLLDAAQMRRATEVAIAAGAAFVKTSTGFHGGGATEEAVRTLVGAAAGRIRVKASGGIRDRAGALRFLELGAERLGVGSTSTAALCGEAAPSGGAPGAY